MAIKERRPWNQTPLIESRTLSDAAGCRIFLKLETFQPGGSFKSRGIANYMLCALKRAKNPSNVHFYSNSGGNAGIAACTAAKLLSVPCTVVVPTTTNAMMVRKIKDAGAQEVIQAGESVMYAEKYLKEVVMRVAESKGQEAVHVMPFDHPDIWEGNATMMAEIRQQLHDMGEGAPDVVGCSVGGGGMLNGIFQSIEDFEAQSDEGWDRTTVLGVETRGAESLANALDKQEHLTLPKITSQAVTLGCARVSARTFELTTRYRANGRFQNAVFTDAEAAMGCWRFADDERMMVELACGVTVALCYGGRLELALRRPVSPDDKVVLIMCGGHGVTLGMIEQWRQEFGDVDVSPQVPALIDDESSSNNTSGEEEEEDLVDTISQRALPVKGASLDSDAMLEQHLAHIPAKRRCLTVA